MTAIRPTPRPHECAKCGQTHNQCLAHNNEGGPCGRHPANGADVCPVHGGHAPQVREAAERRVQIELARQACNRLGIPIVVNPVESLLDAIYEAAGNVEWYRALAAQLPPHPADDVLEEGADGKQHWVRGDPGVYGRTYHASGIPTGEGKKHVLVQMYDEERDRLAKYRHDAISLGLEKRRVDLEEHRAVEVFRAVSQAFAAMGLSERFNEFRDLFAAALANERLVPTGIGASSSTD